MGHIVNPIAFRLYFSKFWNNNWYTSKFNYQYFFIKDLQLNEYFYSFFHLNKRNRIDFSNNMVYDSLSTFRKSNSFYITLNVFDYRLIDFSKAKRIYNIAVHEFRIRKSFLKQYNRSINRSRRRLNLKFLSYPWLYRLYINNYAKKIGNKLVSTTLKNKKIYFYRKKIFLAYTLFFFKNLNKKIELKFLLQYKLKDLIDQILSNYLVFTSNINIKNNNNNLFFDLNQYNKFLDLSKNLLEKKYINYFPTKLKNLNKIRINNFNNKTKKYFFGVFNNILTIKNLIIKYTNLLILLNKRINYFKLKYEDNFHILNFKHLNWKKERLVNLIYYLKSKSFKNKLFFQKKVINLKVNLLNIQEKLKLNIKDKDKKKLIKHQIFLVKNLYRYYKFIESFNSIALLDNKFLLQNYLNILNNINLLRFNYRFAIYKQAHYKHKKFLFKLNLNNRLKKKVLLNLNKFNNTFLTKLAGSIVTFSTSFDKNFKSLDYALQNKIKESIVYKKKKKDIINLNNQKINYKNFLSFMVNYKGKDKVYVKSLNLLRKRKKDLYIINRNHLQINKINKWFKFNKSKKFKNIWNLLNSINKSKYSKILKSKKWPYLRNKLFFMFKRQKPTSKFLPLKKNKEFNYRLYQHSKFKKIRLYNNIIYKYTKKFKYIKKIHNKNFIFKDDRDSEDLLLNDNINKNNINTNIFNIHSFYKNSFESFDFNAENFDENKVSIDKAMDFYTKKKNYLYASYKNSSFNLNIREFIYIKKNSKYNKFLILNKFSNKAINIKPKALFIERIIKKSEEEIRLELEAKKKREEALLLKKKLSLKYFNLFRNKKSYFIFNKNKISKIYFSNSSFLKKYLTKLNISKQFNLNLKKITHVDLHTWNNSSFYFYNNIKTLSFLNTNYNVDLSLFYKNKLIEYNILKRKYVDYNNQLKKIKILIEYLKLNNNNLDLKDKIKNWLYFKNINQLKLLFSEMKVLKKEITRCFFLLKQLKIDGLNTYISSYKNNTNINFFELNKNKSIIFNNKNFKLNLQSNLLRKSKIKLVLNFSKFKKIKFNTNSNYLNNKLLNSNKQFIQKINKNFFIKKNKKFVFKYKSKFSINKLKFYLKFYRSKFFINNKINQKKKKNKKLLFLSQFYNFKNKKRRVFNFKQRKNKFNFLIKSRFNNKLFYTYYKTVINQFSFYNTLIFKNNRVKKNRKKFYKFFSFLIKKENSKFFLKHYNSNYKYSYFFYKNIYRINKKDFFINYKKISTSFYNKLFKINKISNKNYYFLLKKKLLNNNIVNKNLSNSLKNFKKKHYIYNKLINKKLILNKLLFKLKKKKNLNWFFLFRNKNNIIKIKLKNKNFRLNFIKMLKNLKFSSIYIRKFLLNFNNKLYFKAYKKAVLLDKEFKNKQNLLNLNKKQNKLLLLKKKFNDLYTPIIDKDLNFNIKPLNHKVNGVKLNSIIIYEHLLKKYKNYYLNLKNNLRQNIFIFKYKKANWSKNLLKEKKEIIAPFLINNKKLNIDIEKTPRNKEEYDVSLISYIYKNFLKIFNLYGYKYRIERKKKSRFLTMVNYRLIGTYYYYISLFFKWHLTRNFLKNQINNIYVRFNLMLEPSAFILSRYICENLKRKLSLNKIVMSLLYDIPRTFPNIEAIQVKCTGRYSRRQRANKNWYRFGNIRTADINRIIEYASTGVVLRYGYTNIKVWFLKKKESPSLSTSFV